VDGNAHLVQEYRSARTGIPWSVPDTVTIRNTPVRSAERLNHDVGIYAQDVWTLKRLTINAGIRWEKVNAQVLEGSSPAGRFIGERRFPARGDLPDWTDWAPRFALVYDLFGNAKTAVKYSLNRYNRARTTGIADDYNPLDSVTARLPWRDVNGDDIAQGERGCAGFPSVGCEIDFGGLNPLFGTIALNEYGGYPREWNLEHGLELQHELLPRLSVTGSWFSGAFNNLTTTINRALTDVDYIPATIYHPQTGALVDGVFYLNNNARSRASDNLDTFDPERERMYNAFNLEFKARPGRGAQLFGGVSFERELNVNCTAPDNPNSRRFCNDRENDVPFRKNLKLAGSMSLPWGITLSGALQSNQPFAANTSRQMEITRGSTRYPAACPAPCPAGQIIGPSSLMGQSTLVIDLVPSSTVLVERITQLDFKLSKTFRVGRVSVLPTVEVFNVNNTDAIVTYQSTNILAGGYLAPSTIMQPRMLGVGATVRW
jgi:hypothetical protein